MRIFRCLFAFFLILFSFQSFAAGANFEGILGQPIENIPNFVTGQFLGYFMPYNPVMIEIGGYKGEIAKRLSHQYPQGQVFVFEPNPTAFDILKNNVQAHVNKTSNENVTIVHSAIGLKNGTVKLYTGLENCGGNPDADKWSSLLQERYNCPQHCKGPAIDVSCVRLEDWCRDNAISRVDFIRLDVEGYELQILKTCPNLLKSVIALSVKTSMAPYRSNWTQYRQMKQYLIQHDFELLAHWFKDGVGGEALFIKRNIYDSLFR